MGKIPPPSDFQTVFSFEEIFESNDLELHTGFGGLTKNPTLVKFPELKSTVVPTSTDTLYI